MPYRNVEDILEFADVTVFHNSTHYFYIINVPKTHNVNYEEFLIKPVKRNNVINRIEYEYILKNGVDYFGIVEKCKNFNSFSICKDNNVRNISHTTCILRLFKSSEARCNKTNGHHVPLVEEIAADTLLFNDFKGKVDINGTEQDLRGTYLIKFKNITITVNNQSYRSLETTNIQLLPPLLHVGVEKDELVEILSMELIKEMHINNTRQIKLLEAKKETDRWITYSSFSFIFIFLVVAKLFSIFKGSTKTRVVIEPSSKSQLKPTAKYAVKSFVNFVTEPNDELTIEAVRQCSSGEHAAERDECKKLCRSRITTRTSKPVSDAIVLISYEDIRTKRGRAEDTCTNILNSNVPNDL
ncbi:unnamed protein product [Hermetia illucens]|uniref:Uncharacterized protein n=1 Tax=Hermetia illucens TaxID=343691 RepID=A0A7R8UJ17_HERIL|nr:unnamed protein product [Hermetia illucens]